MSFVPGSGMPFRSLVVGVEVSAELDETKERCDSAAFASCWAPDAAGSSTRVVRDAPVPSRPTTGNVSFRFCGVAVGITSGEGLPPPSNQLRYFDGSWSRRTLHSRDDNAPMTPEVIEMA